MIDFKSTHDTPGGMIHFCNENGDSIKQYAMDQLIDYVESNSLNVLVVSANGCSNINPNVIEADEVEPVEDYIDNNWFELTERFYKSLNKSEFKSNNIPKPI